MGTVVLDAVLSNTGRDLVSDQVVRLVNEARHMHGLAPLKINSKLVRAAHFRAADMANRDYFAHTGWLRAIKRAKYRWASAGENIAKGQSSAQEVFEDWMDSPLHRANILAAKYDEIGVARVEDIWVQSFGRR